MMPNIAAIEGTTVWPRALAELAWALSPRRCGQYNYSLHWTAVVSAGANASANGFQQNNVGFVMYQYSGATIGGYLQEAASQVIGTPNTDLINSWQDQNFATLDLVNIESMQKQDRKDDASAFAFDTSGGRAYSSTGNSTLSLVSLIGYNSGVAQYMNVNSSAGLEVKIKRPHLAAIRVCTPIAQYGNPPFHSENTNNQRVARDLLATYSSPSTLGFQRVTPSFRGKLQLKIVPGSGTLLAISNRIEVLANATVTNIGGGTWASSYGLNDINNFIVNLYKTFLKRYSGSNIGVYGVLPSGTLISPEPYERCFAVASYNSIRLPEYVQRILGAHTPFVDKYGTLIPYVSALDVPAHAITYTGTPTYTVAPEPENFGLGVFSQVVNFAYKPFEATMVSKENFMLYGQFGKTFMDVTYLRDSTSVFVSGMISRRAQTPDFVSSCNLLNDVLTYDQVQLTATGTIGYPLEYNHSFNQHNRRMYSGFDSIALYSNINKYDGVVVNALTSNMSDANGPDNAVNSRIPLPAPVLGSQELLRSPARVGIVTKWANRILPRLGKYCGPGWTAGVDTGDEDVHPDRGGKYTVAPISSEDAICKVHDEAYNAAGNDRKKVLAADWEMVKSLRALRKAEGLSIYGYAAELAIASKAGLATLSDEGLKAYLSST